MVRDHRPSPFVLAAPMSIDLTATRAADAEVAELVVPSPIADGLAASARAVEATTAGGGSGTEIATGLELCGGVSPWPVASVRLCAPGASVGGIMTNCPPASAVAAASVLPSSRNSTFAFGAARPATTVSPVGATSTTSKAGLTTAGG